MGTDSFAEIWGKTMNANTEIRSILNEIADQLHPVMPGDDAIEAHRRIQERTPHRMAIECRRAAALPGDRPPKEWVAFLIMASRTLNDVRFNLHLAEYQERLEGFYGPFDPQDMKPDTNNFDRGRAELLRQVQAPQG
ncbi:hypothetical protein D5400_14030 [Georhizobium profundi]|uniref:Uncharacterized protein n=1 Tax=Georhizobium profundi TaxID=2341112 RepID=A0A3Q8XPC9_9HYPH|nr:hypothetical protein D5400_14030 [Georhizobium profundi]